MSLLRAALRHERRHVERLGVVVDHPLHEGDVRLRVRRQLELLELVRRQRLRRPTGSAGLDDVRRRLGRDLGLVGAAAPCEHHHDDDREERFAFDPDHGGILVSLNAKSDLEVR